MVRLKIDLPDQFSFSTLITVRITDINYGGHLGNDTLLSIVHEARVQFFRSINYSEKDIEGASVIMSDAAVVYKGEIFYGDLLQVEVACGNFGNTSFDIFYRISDKSSGREVARVKTGIVMFDYTVRKPVSIPVKFKARFGK